MRNAWFIALKEVKYSFREKETYLWVFVMPVVFMFFIGTVTKRSGGMPGRDADPITLQAPENAGFLALEIERRLAENGFRIDRPSSPEEGARAARRLTIPEGFTESVVRGDETTVTFLAKESGLADDYDRMRVGRAVYTVLADLVACSAGAEEPTPEAFQRLREMPRSLTVEVRPAGRRREIPSGFEQAVPGILVMFTLLVTISGGTVSSVIERRRGLLKRLASCPISPREIVLGKWAGRWSVGLAQVSFGMMAGTVLFKVNWGSGLPMVFLVLAGWAALCTSFALVLANWVTTEQQALAIAILASNALAALGGCWWPIEVTPGWMQTLAKLLPTGWAMDALHQLISFGAGSLQALPHLTGMILLAAGLGWLGAAKFRF